jgi:hypothetical protein
MTGTSVARLRDYLESERAACLGVPVAALAHKLATHPRVAGHVSRLAQEEADR